MACAGRAPTPSAWSSVFETSFGGLRGDSPHGPRWQTPSRQGARTRCGQRQELTVSVCLLHGAATNETHFVESAYASAWLVLLSRGADLAVIREGSTLRGPRLLQSYAELVRVSSSTWTWTCSLGQAPLAASRSGEMTMTCDGRLRCPGRARLRGCAE